MGMVCKNSPPWGEGLGWIIPKKKKASLDWHLCSVILNTHANNYNIL